MLVQDAVAVLLPVLPLCLGAVRSLCPTQHSLVWPWAGGRWMGWDACKGSQKSQRGLHGLRLGTQGEYMSKRWPQWLQLRYYVFF